MRVPSYTWAGGVLSEDLYGRVDLNKFMTGLREAINFRIGVEGGAYKRLGTYLVGRRKEQTKRSKLIPWRIADDDSYILEFADLSIRFIRLGGFISIPDGEPVPAESQVANVDGLMEMPSPYSADEVHEIKYTAANDVFYLFHPNHAPRTLTRYDLYDWRLELLDFDPHPDWSGGGAAVYTDSTTVDDNYDPEPVPTEYKISATLTSGIETKPSAPIVVDADLGHRRTKVVLTWAAVPNAIQYTIYKGKNGIYGFIGYTEELTYTDRNYAPSYDVVPIGDAIDLAEWPRVGEFYKQRLGFASPPSEPQTLYFSRPLLFNSLTKSVPLQDDDAIKVQLVGRQRHTINHMLELKKFIIFTDTSEWVLGTVDNAALSAATIDPTQETHYGANPFLRPLAIGSRILFVQNKTGDIRDLGYEFTSDSYLADDLTRLARGLFSDRSMVAWDYAAYPNNLILCPTGGVTMPWMTYVREHEIWGWSTFETDGNILDVACVTEIDEDGIYLQVERVINGVTEYFIERQEVTRSRRIEEMIYMDCALSYENFNYFEELTGWETETITFKVPLDWPVAVDDELQLEFATRTNDFIRVTVTAVSTEVDHILVTAEKYWEIDWPLEAPATIGLVYKAATVISGLDHLEAADVWVLADGKVLKNLSVEAGAITLPFPAVRVHVGLPFDAALETLDLDFERAAGQFRSRTMDDVWIRLLDSRGVYCGNALADRELELIPSRDQENYWLPNTALNGPYRVPTHVHWSEQCRVRVESHDPLPVNILNIVPDIIYED